MTDLRSAPRREGKTREQSKPDTCGLTITEHPNVGGPHRLDPPRGDAYRLVVTGDTIDAGSDHALRPPSLMRHPRADGRLVQREGQVLKIALGWRCSDLPQVGQVEPEVHARMRGCAHEPQAHACEPVVANKACPVTPLADGPGERV